MKLFFLFLLLAFIPASFATQYYVRKDGNDGNTGTADTSGGAWLTIQKAADTMVAGDTVTVGAGTFSERVTSSTSGTSGNEITFEGNKDTTIVGAWYITHAYIIIDGFTVDCSQISGNQGGITLATGGNNNTVRNVFIDSSEQHGYYHLNDVTNCTFEDSRIENPRLHAVNTFGSGHTIQRSYFHSRLGADVFRILSSTTTIKDNFIDNWGNPFLTSGTLKIGNQYQWFDVSGSPDFSNVGAGSGPYSVSGTFTATGTTPTSWGTASVQNTNHTDLYQSFSVGGAYTSQNVVVERNLHINCDYAQIGNFEDQASATPYENKQVSDWTFRNNIFVDVGNQMNGYIEDFHWYNNTFVRCSTEITGPVLFFNYSGLPGDSGMKGNSHGAKVKNNIFYECGNDSSSASKGWYFIHASNTSTEADNNLVIGTGGGTTKTGFVTGSYEASGVNGSDPLFIDDDPFSGSPREVTGWDGVDQATVRALAANFKVTTSSPVEGAGESQSGTFTDDYEEQIRSPWDIGAYEFAPGGSSSNMTVSGDLTVTGALRFGN